VTAHIEPRQVLTCRLGTGFVGIDFLWVRDVVFSPAIVTVPDKRPWVAGGMSMGETLAPVVDLRARFGLAPPPEGQCRPVVVVAVGPLRAGLRVDGVGEVVALRPGALDLGVSRPGVHALLRVGTRVVEMLDLGEVLAG